MAKRTMTRVRKAGFEGVYKREYEGHRVRYTSRVPDPTRKSGVRQLGTHDTAELARAEYREEMAQLVRPRARSMRERREQTLNEFHARWNLEFNLNNRKGSKRTANYSLKIFLERFGEFTFNQFPYDAIRSWGRTCPLSYMKAARAWLNDAAEDNLLPEDNPLSCLGREESRGRADVEIISREELMQLADCAIVALGADYGPVFRSYLLFAAFTGLRGAELRPLLRSNLLFPTGQVRVLDSAGDDSEITDPKNHRHRVVAFPEPAQQAVRSFNMNQGSPYVWTNIRGGRITKSTENRYWNETRIAMAGATGDPSWARKEWYEVTRHFAGSFLLNDCQLPVELVAFQLGHSDGGKLVLRLYGHVDEQRWATRINEAVKQETERQEREKAGKPARKLRAVE